MNAIHEPTHEITNQVPALEGYDAYGDDVWLTAAVQRAGAEWIGERASSLGRYVGSPEGQHHATLANRYTPELKTYDRVGNRIDFVEYHPSYHVLMKRAFTAGVHSLAWKPAQARFTARAALFHVWNQLEQGTACPITMTFASIPVLEQLPSMVKEWRRKILADAYDPEMRPVSRKTGATIGMAMTEKQGGSDLRAIQTRAERGGDRWRLTGHKWFCSAPMSDAFFTLARTPEGVTCFFVPRTLPGGVRNPFLIQRLKEKVGNRSNASAEIELRDTEAWMVGEPGRGIATLINMAHHTRFDIVVGVAGMMRSALNQALHHATHRAAFGKPLVEHPLMANVLADLALEAESATLLAFRVAAAFDAGADDPAEAALQRLLTPIAKYWLCKRMPVVAAEAMECWGGNGYVEESPLARLYREAPLNGIWEGSANVICLDVMRALARSPDAFTALAAEIAAARDPALDGAMRDVEKLLGDPAAAEGSARRIVERLATCTAASLMRRYSHPHAADAFRASRVSPDVARVLGTLEVPARVARHVLDRARLQGR
ncbi:MAG TPA: acyl-CoA dehydrogenase family protein [Usitatibacter sp.]|nr:acyl-CoA dehydrogenase family protein [Usitatibacter sp.]